MQKFTVQIIESREMTAAHELSQTVYSNNDNIDLSNGTCQLLNHYHQIYGPLDARIEA